MSVCVVVALDTHSKQHSTLHQCKLRITNACYLWSQTTTVFDLMLQFSEEPEVNREHFQFLKLLQNAFFNKRITVRHLFSLIMDELSQN